VDRWWQALLGRVDLEHIFGLFKQTLGWTCPKLRTSAAADRCTWLIIVAYPQLRSGPPAGRRSAPPLGTPRSPAPATRPGVRRGFRNIRPITLPAHAPKPGRPTRAPAARLAPATRHPAINSDVGKTVKRNKTVTARPQSIG